MRNRTSQLHSRMLLKSKQYHPEKLLDALLGRYRFRNDASLSRALRVSPALISRVRSKEAPVTSSLLVRLHDALGLDINEARELMGVGPMVPRIPMMRE